MQANPSKRGFRRGGPRRATMITVSTVSNAQFDAALEDGLADTQLLFPLALIVIAALLVVVLPNRVGHPRSPSRASSSPCLWFTGAQGLLGPRGLGLVGPAGVIGAVIPVMMIGLSVDYALQFIGRRREHHAGGPTNATEEAVRFTGAAIALGASTTAIAFSTNTLGPLPPIRDFGLLAAIGIVAAMVVMLTFVPAARTLLDRRRSRRGKTPRPQRPTPRRPAPRHHSDARNVAVASARRSTAVLVVAAARARSPARSRSGSGCPPTSPTATSSPTDTPPSRTSHSSPSSSAAHHRPPPSSSPATSRPTQRNETSSDSISCSASQPPPTGVAGQPDARNERTGSPRHRPHHLRRRRRRAHQRRHSHRPPRHRQRPHRPDRIDLDRARHRDRRRR